MNRLIPHSNRVLRRKLFLAVLGLFFLLIFLFIFGIKFLVQTAVLISNLTAKNQPSISSTEKNESFFGSIEITDIPTATNSPTIIVYGQVNNYDLIEFYLNGNKVKEVKTFNSFAEEISNLKPGNNEIYLVAKSTKSSSKKKTPKYQVTMKNQKPTLEIIEPSDNLKTNKEEIIVKGKTDKEVFIKVNNLPVVVNVLGEFQTAVKLQPGENKIEILAQDIAGNSQSKIITIIYEKE